MIQAFLYTCDTNKSGCYHLATGDLDRNVFLIFHSVPGQPVISFELYMVVALVLSAAIQMRHSLRSQFPA